MFKTVFLSAAAAALIAGATLSAPIAAEAAMTCKEMAKAKYPSMVEGMKARRAYKKTCKDKAKAQAESPGLMGRFAFLNRRT